MAKYVPLNPIPTNQSSRDDDNLVKLSDYALNIPISESAGNILQLLEDGLFVTKTYTLQNDTIHDGVDDPSDSLYDNGEFYLNTTTGGFFKKVNGSWVLKLTLSGSPGADGDAGTVTRIGSLIPADDLGENGDFYIRIDTTGLYRKASGIYELLFYLKGEQGDPGETPDLSGYQLRSERGEDLGYAPINAYGKVPRRFIPGYTNDVLEYDTFGDFPDPGTTGKIYIASDTDLNYHWDADTTSYVLTSSTAVAGAWYIESGTPDDDFGLDHDHYINSINGDVYEKTAGAWGSPVMNITGPAGEDGVIGVDGDPGPAGDDGADGKTILYGTAVPTTEGVDGDFYIRTTTHFIYGPKSSDTWPSGTSLVGPAGADGADGVIGSDGADGADGNTILYGTAAPTTQGVNGDFYIRTTTSFIYGPKAAGSWPSGTSLIGAAGTNGTNGSNGTNGNTVLYGTAAPTTEGVNGDFYIRTTTNFIYGPKAAGSWPAGTSLVGATGTNGTNGTNGSNGTSYPALSVAVKTADYTLVNADFAGNVVIEMNVSSGTAHVTVPSGITNLEPVTIFWRGNIQPDLIASGVTLKSAGGFLKIRIVEGGLMIIPVASNVFRVIGDTAA